MGGDSVRISIRQQLGAGICLLVFCALALSLLMIDHNLSENYEEKVKADSVAAADSLARNIAQFINNTNIMNQMIASYPRLQELPREEQQQLLARILDVIAERFDRHAVLRGGMVLRLLGCERRMVAAMRASSSRGRKGLAT